MAKKEHSSKVHPSLDKKPGKSNWVDEEGDLPEYVAAVAKHIFNDNPGKFTRSHAIAAAVEKMKKDAASGNARAQRSLAKWERMKANRGRKAVDLAKGDDEDKKKGTPNIGKPAVRFNTGASGVRSAMAGNFQKTHTRGASSIGRTFDESKIVRDFGGRFDDKVTPAAFGAARRVVESAITSLQVGRSVNLPGGIGWIQRTEGGYVIQGGAGQRMVVRSASEAVAAAATILGKNLQEK